MNKLSKNSMIRIALVLTLVLAAALPCFAANEGSADFSAVTDPVVNLINSLLNPVLAIVGAAGSIYCVILGVKYARAEEPQDREKAKTHLKNALIGFVLIFVLIVVLKQLMPIMQNWVTDTKVTTKVK